MYKYFTSPQDLFEYLFTEKNYIDEIQKYIRNPNLDDDSENKKADWLYFKTSKELLNAGEDVS